MIHMQSPSALSRAEGLYVSRNKNTPQECLRGVWINSLP